MGGCTQKACAQIYPAFVILPPDPYTEVHLFDPSRHSMNDRWSDRRLEEESDDLAAAEADQHLISMPKSCRICD